MTIYFVRHGESVNNVGKLYQGADVELSEKGKQQAEFVANRFQHVPVDIILASNYTRAHDTAKAIKRVTQKPLEVLSTLIERKRPSSFENKPYDDPSLEEIRGLIDNHPDPDHHHSDEENFFDVKKRAEEVIRSLEQRTEENIIVVSHGIFLKTILMSLLLKDSFNLENFNNSDALHFENTAITVCEFRGKEKGWKIKTINDFAHLAEPS